MTQLVNKASSWRTLRHKVVVGASSIALVAGMGVALAPSAAAAVAPKVTVDFAADNVANTPAGTVNFDVKIDNSAAGTGALSGLSGVITLTFPDGVKCGAVTAPPAAADSLGKLGVVAAAAPFTAPTGGTTTTEGNVCSYTVPVANIGATAAASTATFSVTGAGANSSGPAFTGVIKAEFKLTSAPSGQFEASWSASDTVNLVAQGAPSFVAGSVATPIAGYSYSYKLMASNGFTATGANDLNGVAGAKLQSSAAGTVGWAAVGRHLKADGTYDEKRVTDTSDGAAADGVIVLSATDADGAVRASGFSFNANTGRIQAATVQTNADQYWTWTIVANNGIDGAAGAVAANGLTPALAAHDVASNPFDLNTAPAKVAFSDYSETSAFGTEVWALAKAGIIQGYSNGTFGPEKPVTRQAFAAYVVRTLKAVVTDASMDSVPTGKCAISPFADVDRFSEFCGEIGWLASQGITEGYDNGKNFKPTEPITRQAIAAMLYRANSLVSTNSSTHAVTVTGTVAALPQCTTASAFADVSQDNPFCGAIEWAAGTDPAITTGTKVDDTTSNFKPADATSRQAASTFFYRLANVVYKAANPTATDTFWTK